MVATNYHVIEGAAGGYAKGVGQERKVRLLGTVGTDPKRDLAVLKLAEPKSPAVLLGDDASLEPGDEVFAIGNPQGLEGTISQGIVSGVRTLASDRLIQITAPISPGSSGGPVVGNDGRVVGIAVGTFSEGQNLNFAIPVSALSTLLGTTHQAPVSHFSASGVRSSSVASGIGRTGYDAIGVSNFTWTWDLLEDNGEYSISVINKLNVPISDVRILFIFFDADKKPLDFDDITCVPSEIFALSIPPGLAKRCSSRVSGDTRKLQRSGTFRVLDFRVAR